MRPVSYQSGVTLYFLFFVCLFGVLIFDQVKLEPNLFYVSDSCLFSFFLYFSRVPVYALVS